MEVDTANLPSSVRAGSPSSAQITITDDRTIIDDTPPDDTTTDDTPTGGGPPPEGPSDSAPSADASLRALKIEEASLDFYPDTYNYTVTVYGETLTLTPTANHPDAEITVNTYPVQSGSPATFALDDYEGEEISIQIEVDRGERNLKNLHPCGDSLPGGRKRDPGDVP